MTVQFHPAFATDLDAAAGYYQEKAGPELRTDFLKEVFSTIEQIKINPLGFSKSYGQVRRARLKRFKVYAIRYRFTEETNTLRILSVLHGARHPEYGKKRSD